MLVCFDISEGLLPFFVFLMFGDIVCLFLSYDSIFVIQYDKTFSQIRTISIIISFYFVGISSFFYSLGVSFFYVFIRFFRIESYYSHSTVSLRIIYNISNSFSVTNDFSFKIFIIIIMIDLHCIERICVPRTLFDKGSSI